MREIIINNQPYFEEIFSYDHTIGDSVRIIVGIGNTIDTKFVFDKPQNYSFYKVKDSPEVIQSMTNIVLQEAITDYTDLLNMGNGLIYIDNLWTMVDRIRARESQ
jgi:hypothetical protein